MLPAFAAAYGEGCWRDGPGGVEDAKEATSRSQICRSRRNAEMAAEASRRLCFRYPLILFIFFVISRALHRQRWRWQRPRSGLLGFIIGKRSRMDAAAAMAAAIRQRRLGGGGGFSGFGGSSGGGSPRLVRYCVEGRVMKRMTRFGTVSQFVVISAAVGCRAEVHRAGAGHQAVLV